MTLFPPTALFFINTWTWGYEDILKAISIAFRSKVRPITFVDIDDPSLMIAIVRSMSTDTNIPSTGIYPTHYSAHSLPVMLAPRVSTLANDSAAANTWLLKMGQAKTKTDNILL